jgi:hypothetical protein
MDESDQRSEPREPRAGGGSYPDPGPDVVVNAMLCDSAFVMNGQVLVMGGVRHIFAGSGSPLQVLSVGLGAHVEPPAHRASGRHALQIRLREIRDGKAGAPLPRDPDATRDSGARVARIDEIAGDERDSAR